MSSSTDGAAATLPKAAARVRSSPTVDSRERLSAMEKVSLAREIVATYRFTRGLLSSAPFPTAVAELRRLRPPAETSHEDRAALLTASRIAFAVVRVLKLVPARTACLTQSIVLLAMLERRGIDSRLVIGVKATGDFGAHAWIEVNGVAVLPSADFGEGRLVTF